MNNNRWYYWCIGLAFFWAACGEVKTSPPDGAGPCQAENDRAFCQRQGKDCEAVTAFDNCGTSRTVNCGSCSPGAECGGGGTPNVCWSDIWAEVAAQPAPPPRSYATMVYDSARQVVVLFGGAGTDYQNDLRNDTWEWDGAQWTARPAALQPPPRWGASMAYDSARQVVVLFGGNDGSKRLGDTWEWDGNTWTNKNVQTSPRARHGAAMAYDSARRVSVLFGGTNDNGAPLDDTWEWDGNAWIQRNPANSPSARSLAAMAYDSQRNAIVLYGGYTLDTDADDTWEWTGTNWLGKTPANVPPSVNGHAMAYDSARGVMMSFGGYDAPGGPTNYTWEYDGTTWTEKSPSARPPARAGLSVAYDAARARIVLFGGANGNTPYGDTWTR